MNSLAVKLSIAAVHYAGRKRMPKSDIPSWRVTFELGGQHFLPTSLTIQTVGPKDTSAARRDASMMLRCIAQAVVSATEAAL